MDSSTWKGFRTKPKALFDIGKPATLWGGLDISGLLFGGWVLFWFGYSYCHGQLNLMFSVSVVRIKIQFCLSQGQLGGSFRSDGN